MGQIIIHDGPLNRQFRSDTITGTVELTLSGDEIELVVPDDIAIEKREITA